MRRRPIGTLHVHGDAVHALRVWKTTQVFDNHGVCAAGKDILERAGLDIGEHTTRFLENHFVNPQHRRRQDPSGFIPLFYRIPQYPAHSFFIESAQFRQCRKWSAQCLGFQVASEPDCHAMMLINTLQRVKKWLMTMIATIALPSHHNAYAFTMHWKISKLRTEAPC